METIWAFNLSAISGETAMGRRWDPGLCRPILLGAVLSLLPAVAQAKEWEPAAGTLATRWAGNLSPEKVHSEYPRPTLVRTRWQNLNGLWDHAVLSREDRRPASYPGKILVPFPVESALSGVSKRLGDKERLWYRRTFKVPAGWGAERVLLHFGAVDWEATVWVNGKSWARTAAATTLQLRHDRRADEGWPAGDGRRRLGPDRRRSAAARQAGRSTRRHLVHADHAASGRRCGSSRCRERTSQRSSSCRTWTPARRGARPSTGAGDAAGLHRPG